MTTSDDPTAEIGNTQRTALAAATAIGTLFVLTYVGYLVFDDLVYGLVAGAFSGFGTYLLFQYVLAGGLAEDGAGDEAVDGVTEESAAGDRQTSGGVHGGAAGFALDAGGVAMLSAGFVSDGTLLMGVLTAVAVSLLGYAILERTLPQPEP